MDPMPIRRIKIKVDAKRHGARERRVDFDFSRGHDKGHYET